MFPPVSQPCEVRNPSSARWNSNRKCYPINPVRSQNAPDVPRGRRVYFTRFMVRTRYPRTEKRGAGGRPPLRKAITVAKPFKPTRTFPLPPNSDILEHNGKPHVRMKERGKPVLYRISNDGTKYLRPSKKWHFELRDATGIVRRVKGFADLKATEQLAAEMERKASRVRSGFSDPAEEHAGRPLAEHLKDYAAYLEAKGNVPRHIRGTISKIKTAFSGCAFVADVDAGKFSAWLANLRHPKRTADIPPGEAFASSEVAKVFGISTDAVRRFVARHRLPTVGNGSARRLLRTSVETIAENQSKGAGPATANHYLTAARGFFRWLVKVKRIGSDPLDSLTLVNAAVDVRRTRRELTAEELRLLLVGTRASQGTFRGLTGSDRYFLYLAAAGTGFRANALANLTPAVFDLDAETPTVTLAARFNKSRKLKVQPLPLNVAAALRDFIAGKPDNAPLWGETWAKEHRGAEMLRADLEAVGIPYVVEGPDGPEYADFHALRHTYLTMLGRNGVDLRTAQELAGHSTPTLTARYSHRRLYDLAGAVDKLPNLVPTIAPVSNATELPLRMTGTDTVSGAVTGDIGLHRTALKYTLGIFDGTNGDSPQLLEMKGAGASQHRPASICTKWAVPGLNRGPSDFQSLALPTELTTLV